jgi:hypothetical protein
MDTLKEAERKMLIKMAIILIAYFGLIAGLAYIVGKLMGLF